MVLALFAAIITYLPTVYPIYCLVRALTYGAWHIFTLTMVALYKPLIYHV